VPVGDLLQAGRVDRVTTAAKREKRHEGDAVLCALRQEGRVAGVVVHVEGVLHGGHRGHRAGLGELGGVDVADAQVADQALVAQRSGGSPPRARRYGSALLRCRMRRSSSTGGW
jgi:hypothetical protein